MSHQVQGYVIKRQWFLVLGEGSLCLSHHSHWRSQLPCQKDAQEADREELKHASQYVSHLGSRSLEAS